MYDLKVFDSPEQAALSLAGKFIERAKNAIHNKGRCILALSGGASTLKLYDAVGNLPDPGPDFWNHLIVCWVDERHVPQEHNESNFGNAFRYFWEKIKGPTLISVPWNEAPGLSVKMYLGRLTEHGIKSGDDIDLLFLGMGEDGHTASLFPEAESLQIRNSNITTHINENEGINRITMTYPMINKAQKIDVFAYGKEKGTAFGRAISSQRKQKYPIIGIRSEKCTFYVDNLFYKSATGFVTG